MLLKWGLAIAVVAAVAIGFYAYNRVDEEVRRHVEEKFAEHYRDLKVTVHSATRVEGEGIEVRGLSISEPHAVGPRAELAHFDEMFLACDAELPALLVQEPRVSRVVIRRAHLQATRRPDGSWSTAQLLPLPCFGTQPPEVVIENCTMEFFDPLKNPSSTLNVRDVNLVVTPIALSHDAPTADASHLVSGTLVAEHCQRIEFTGRLADGGRRWEFTGLAEGLELCPELHDTLPGNLAERLAVLRSVRSMSQFKFRISQDKRHDPPVRFAFDGQLVRGRIEDKRLPYPLTDTSGRVYCDNNGLHIEDLRARNGQTALWVRRAVRRGFGPNAPLVIEGRCDRLMIDRDVLDSLPEAWRGKWHEFFLAGIVDLDVKLAYDGQRWKPDILVNCVDTSFTYVKFPYRLEQGRGSLRFKDETIDLSLRAYSGADEVSLVGKVVNLSDPEVWFEVRADRLALDQKLLDALPEGPRHALRELRPYGAIRVEAEFTRRPGPQAQFERLVRIDLLQCSINHERFPYPIHNIRGTLDWSGDAWTCRELRGNNDTGEIECRGSFHPTPQGSELAVQLVGRNIALEDELRSALPSHLQSAWQDIKPRGLANLDADVHYALATKKLSLGLRATPVADTVSIEPRFFPYRLEGMRGELIFRDGRLEFGRAPGPALRAFHNGVELAARGACTFAPAGNWQVSVDDLVVYRLQFDRDLQAALAPRVRDLVRKIDPRGTINVSGRMSIAGQAEMSPKASWDLDVTFQQASVRAGLNLNNIYGGVHLVGGFDGQQVGSKAELGIDSVTWRNVQLTEVTGPAWIDSQRVLVGSWAEKPAPGRPPRQLVAKAYDGRVVGNAWILLGGTPRYALQGSIVDADLSRCAHELFAGQQQMLGKVQAGIDLHGNAEGLHTLAGKGYVRLHDADIYRIPQMMSLLSVVSLKPPDTTAFTTSDIDFRVDGDHLYFDRIDFKGDAISLKGRGEMNFSSDVALTFYALVGRDEL
ncbi:MAG: AsmA-like C-terminal region-containing protein, partial [Pirellulales bacterium]